MYSLRGKEEKQMFCQSLQIMGRNGWENTQIKEGDEIIISVDRNYLEVKFMRGDGQFLATAVLESENGSTSPLYTKIISTPMQSLSEVLRILRTELKMWSLGPEPIFVKELSIECGDSRTGLDVAVFKVIKLDFSSRL
ncbi:MAG: hypothetical protein ABIH21_03105 [Patescibacteria group bacterium]